jgi:hypothetical protein
VHFIVTHHADAPSTWSWRRLEEKGKSTVPTNFTLWEDRIAEATAARDFGPVIAAHETVEAMCRMVQSPERTRHDRIFAVIMKLDDLAHESEHGRELRDLSDELHLILDELRNAKN